MVFTLHKYIFRELFKVFVLAALALTLILSLGSILRPVQEYGVGPRQVVHLMAYFLPIILTFVLPMAALFAAALVYGRFANDNELDACRASGVSLLTLVYPGLALAIMVATANLILSFHVMPYFVHLAEKSLKANAKQILFRNIQRRGYYKSPGGLYVIYADETNLQSNTLSGVVIAEVKNHKIQKIIATESARVRFSSHGNLNEVRITADNTYQIGPEGEGWFSVEWLSLTKEFPSLLGDDIKFKKLHEMKEIRDVDPMLFYPIARLARETYVQFTVELLAEDIAGKTANDSNSFYKLHSDQKLVEFSASHCALHDEEKVELSGEVVVVEYDADSRQHLQTLRCTRALLHIEGDELTPTLTMVLYNATWRHPDGSEGLTQRHTIRGLIIPKAVGDVANKFATEDGLDAKKLASESLALRKGPSSKLKGLQVKLQKKIDYTLAEIEAEVHSRLVFGIGCVPVIMIGIGLGIILRGGHLLSAFGASSVPATVLVVCVMSGYQITRNLAAQIGSGIVLMWAGLALMSLLAVVIYRKLLKN